MITTSIPVAKLRRRVIGGRKIDKANVKAIAKSISEIGIINPLRVRPARITQGGRECEGYEVVAGGHRYEAAMEAGLEAVPCIVVEDDDLHAELAMIDENLCRAELSDAERAQQTARRKAIYEELHPETRNGATGVGREKVRQVGEAIPAERFTADTAAATGKSERTVQREAERGERIVPQALDLIKGTDLDKGAYLDKLKKVPADQQVIRVQRDLQEIARMQAREREEAIEKRNKSKIDADVQRRAAREIAEILCEKLDHDALTHIRANLSAVKKVDLILSEMANLLGEAVMDRAAEGA